MDSVSRVDFDPRNAPPGPWRKMWSHIPFCCKKSFYNCFAKNERIDGALWKKALNKYRRTLEKGADDLQSYAIIPDAYKVVSQETIDKYKNKK